MPMENHDNDLLSFRMLGKPEVTNERSGVAGMNDFLEVKPVSFSTELKALKAPPLTSVFVVEATRLGGL